MLRMSGRFLSVIWIVRTPIGNVPYGASSGADGVTTSMRLVCADATAAATARTATAIALRFFGNRVLEVITVSAAFVDVHRAAGTGSRPLFLIASTAAGDEKKATSARAAAGTFVPA